MATNSFITAVSLTGAAKTNALSASFVTTGLSIPLNPGEKLVINVTFIVQCSSTGGVKIQTSALPAGATGRISLEGNTTSAAVYAAISSTTPAVSPQTWVTFAGTGMVTGVIEIEVGATGGTLDILFAPATNAQTATIHVGSNALALRV
jgi:hypothetical protein